MAKVELYTSSVAGSIKVTKDTDGIKFLLEANKIPYTEIDISLDENEEHKKYLLDKSGSRTIPKVFVNDEYKADYKMMEEANDDGMLRQLLGLE